MTRTGARHFHWTQGRSVEGGGGGGREAALISQVVYSYYSRRLSNLAK